MYTGTGPSLYSVQRNGTMSPYYTYSLSPQLSPSSYPWWAESITDDLQGNSENTRKERYCKHTKAVNDIHIPEVAYNLPLMRQGHWWTQNRRAADAASDLIASGMSLSSALDRLRAAVSSTSGSLPTFSNVDTMVMKTKAYTAMAPRVGEGLSLVNFLLELKDFRHIIKVVRRASNFLSLGGLLWEPKRSAVWNAANHHLQVSFGYIPFAQDVATIWKTLWGFHDKLLWLERNVGKVVTNHYRYRFNTVPRIDWGWSGKIGSNGEATWWSPVTDSWFPNQTCVKWRYHIRPLTEPTLPGKPTKFTDPTYHATLRYRYKLGHTEGLRRTCLAFLDALGVNGNPAVIWNAIPFSFVVDWFLAIGPWLDNLKLDNLGIVTEVLDMSHSIKWAMEGHLYADTYRYQSGGLIPVSINCARFERSYYERIPTYPGSPLFDADGLNVARSLLSASLAIMGRK